MQNELADEFYREQQVARANEVQQMHEKTVNSNRTANNIMADLPADVLKYVLTYHETGTEKTKKHLDNQNIDYTKFNKERGGSKNFAWARAAPDRTKPVHEGLAHWKFIKDDHVSYGTFNGFQTMPEYNHKQY